MINLHRLRARQNRSPLILSLLCVVLVACDGSGNIGSSASATDAAITIPPPADGTDPSGGEDGFSLSVPATLALVEGSVGIRVSINLFRNGGHDAPVSLSISGLQPADEQNLVADFSITRLEGSSSKTTLSLAVGVGMAPRLVQQRTLLLSATDGTTTQELAVDLRVAPIAAPDVYLLIGQSNMVGFSGSGQKRSGAGEPDEPVERIRQLNVTANDAQNFTQAADFTSTAQIVAWPRIVRAEDPLHQSFDPSVGGKSGTFIGPGLSFAKAAMQATSQNVVLVPAAWSGSGFCNNGLDNVAWNAVAAGLEQGWLGGTSLYDRALARINLALQETGGILRGILWHQGEADATDALCANDYADNLMQLIRSLRSDIQPDARGVAARGPDADIPFLLGTMSRGNDSRGAFSEFDSLKTTVDNVHRTLPGLLPSVGVSVHDDLVPAAYPCGEGSCIHFGADAYREMGQRYFAQLSAIWSTTLRN